jgi:hypothetical protein
MLNPLNRRGRRPTMIASESMCCSSCLCKEIGICMVLVLYYITVSYTSEF